MSVLNQLAHIWDKINYPFLIYRGGELRFADIADSNTVDLSDVQAGDVVALIGDFNSRSIQTLLKLIDRQAVLVPLTVDTRGQHDYFFEAAHVDIVIE